MKRINKAIEAVSDYADETLEKTTKAANQATSMLSERGEQLKETEQRLVKNTSHYIQDNPITSMGIAIGIGFLLSKLFSTNDR